MGYYANSAGLVQTPLNAASDQGLHCLQPKISIENTVKMKHPSKKPYKDEQVHCCPLFMFSTDRIIRDIKTVVVLTENPLECIVVLFLFIYFIYWHMLYKAIYIVVYISIKYSISIRNNALINMRDPITQTFYRHNENYFSQHVAIIS